MNLHDIMIEATSKNVIEGKFRDEVFYVGKVYGVLYNLEKSIAPSFGFFNSTRFKVLDKAEVTMKLLSADYKII